MNDLERAEFLAKIKEAALKIDPENAVTSWWYGHIIDPYGIEPEIPPEAACSGRLYFAKAPDSDIWVCSEDLPGDVVRKLKERTRKYPNEESPAGTDLFYDREASDFNCPCCGHRLIATVGL